METLRVLIVEDDPGIAASIEQLVTGEGHSVCGVVSEGRKVVPIVRELGPDIVLMDVHLEDELSGIEVTRELVALFNIPVIIVSATGRPEELRAIAECGALGFIKKPVSGDEFRVNLRIATNHREALRQLRMSEIMHRHIFDDAAVGIYVAHRDGYYVSCNKAFARMLGYAGPGELLHLVVNADDQIYAQPGRRQELLTQMEAGKNVVFAQSQVYGKDGNMLWFSEHLAPTLDDNGAFIFYKGVAIDISDRKRAENERRVAYSLMQTTMDAIADFIVVTDLDGCIIFANAAFEREFDSLVGEDRILVFENAENCPYTRFQQELDTPTTPNYQVRGHCALAGYPGMLSVSITRYETAEGEILGAVFVMRALGDERDLQNAVWSPS